MLHITVNVMTSGAKFICPQRLVLVHICETHTVSLHCVVFNCPCTRKLAEPLRGFQPSEVPDYLFCDSGCVLLKHPQRKQ